MNSLLTIALYSPDVLQHACPVIRVIGPAEGAGLRLIRGVEFEQSGTVRIFPEFVADSDLVVIQRDFARHTQAYRMIIENARERGKPVIYELDDLLIELPDWHPDNRQYRPARASILQSITDADAVTVSTHALQRYIKRFNSNTWVLPNYLHDRLWSVSLENARQHQDGEETRLSTLNDPVVIGYIGSHTHAADLEMVASPLVRILDRYKGSVVLKCWGTRPPTQLLNHSNVEWIDLGLVDYGQFARYFGVRPCDVFIAPLQDCLFNRCKSHLKYLEYSAMGIAGVYSRIEPYENIVVQRQNGLLASSVDEWDEFIALLVDNPTERYRMGMMALKTVTEEWLLSVNASKWREVYINVTTNSSPSPSRLTNIQVSQQWTEWYSELEQTIETLEQRIKEQEQLIQTVTVEREKTIRQMHEEHNDVVRALQDMQTKKETELTRTQQRLRFLEAQLAVLENSPGWRLLQVLNPLRDWLIPRYSKRDRTFQEGMHALWILKREGFGSIKRRLAMRLHPAIIHGQSLAHEKQLSQSNSLTVSVGTPCPMPAISVVVIKGGNFDSLDEKQVIDWVTAQSFNGIELAFWDLHVGQGCIGSDKSAAWPAPDIETMCQGLRGKYFCIASNDLLEQSNTYLESNLIALETEQLAFTVNLHGHPAWVTPHLEQGCFPGSPEQMFLRQVIRRECALSDGTIRVRNWLASRSEQDNPVGRIIYHTTNEIDRPESLPISSQRSTDYDVNLFDGYLIAHATPAASTVSSVSLLMHDLAIVLPPQVNACDKPTVIIAMPLLAVGGAEQLALDMIAGLRDQFRFVVLATERHEESLGSTTDAFRNLTPFVYTSGDFITPSLSLVFVQRLIEQYTADVLYIANGIGWLYDALSALKQQFPRLRIVNQVYDHNAGWINRYDQKLATLIDAHIGVNSNICEAYKRLGVSKSGIYLIEHCVDTANFDPNRYSAESIKQLRHQLGLPDGRRVITFMARFHPQKRPMDFVELARRFEDDSSLVFLMVGDGPLGQTVDAEISRIKLGNIVRHSFYNPSRDIYAVTDVFVLPSEYEGMPLVILEAQAMGKPVVVTDVGNTREILDITKGGVVVAQIGDIGTLREGIMKVLDHSPDPYVMRRVISDLLGIPKVAAKYKRAFLGELNA